MIGLGSWDESSVPKATTTIGSDLDELLAEACDRNSPAEIVFAHRVGPPLVARARLLELSDECIRADKPSKGQQKGMIPSGRPITVHVSLRGKRFQFDSVILDQRAWIQLNPEHRIPGIVLRRPHELVHSERRFYYRVSLVGIAPVQIELARAEVGDVEACLLEPGVFGGRMLNLSAGGLAVLIDRRDLRSAKQGERFFMGFSLPGVDDPCCQLAEVRHVQQVEASDSIRLAFAFVKWSGQNYAREQGVLSRFIVAQQRRLLRLRK